MNYKCFEVRFGLGAGGLGLAVEEWFEGLVWVLEDWMCGLENWVWGLEDRVWGQKIRLEIEGSVWGLDCCVWFSASSLFFAVAQRCHVGFLSTPFSDHIPRPAEYLWSGRPGGNPGANGWFL